MTEQNNMGPGETQAPAPPTPSLQQMEGAKDALFTFVMYHFQALRQAGYDTDTAKQKTAEVILELYDKYATAGGITFKPNTMVNPMTQLDEIISDVKALGFNARPLLNKLMDFKRLIDSKGE